MERLTEGIPQDICSECDEYYMCDCEHFYKVFMRLKKYEDAEEQGLLIRLPCKVGEFVWVAKHGEKTRRVLLDSMSDILWEIEHGYAIGYTKEEAEQALKEGVKNGYK